MVRKLLKFIVKARMLYADLRGHHGKRWNYEPGDWYMGRKNKKKQEITMPMVNGKKYPYTKKGKAAAKKAKMKKKKKGKK